MLTSLPATYECIKAFAQTDFTEDLKKFDVPTLIMHGDDDQVVPIAITALVSSKLVKGATLKVYPGLPHGMCATHKDLINADLLEFSRAKPARQPELREIGMTNEKSKTKIVVIGGTGLIGQWSYPAQ